MIMVAILGLDSRYTFCENSEVSTTARVAANNKITASFHPMMLIHNANNNGPNKPNTRIPITCLANDINKAISGSINIKITNCKGKPLSSK